MASLLDEYEEYVTQLALTKFKTSDIKWFVENKDVSLAHLRMLTLLVVRDKDTFWTHVMYRSALNSNEVVMGILHGLFAEDSNDKVRAFCADIVDKYRVPQVTLESNKISEEFIKGVNTFLLHSYKSHKNVVH